VIDSTEEGRAGVTTMFEDWHAIHTLLVTYAEHVDAGRFSDAAAMFQDATYRIDHADRSEVSQYEGSAQVQEFFAGTRLYPDGTPRTRHVVTNVNIQIDGERASSRCYATVLQQTDELPLQPIASGRYVDRFERVRGEWRFADRLITGFLLGDRSQHIDWAAETSGP
jgi:3-phenylpropionate/cinnamic acid dioxygenase small subunit